MGLCVLGGGWLTDAWSRALKNMGLWERPLSPPASWNFRKDPE